MDLGLLQLVVTHALAARAGTWALQTVAQRARRGKPAAHPDEGSNQQRSKSAPQGLPSGARAKNSHHGKHHPQSAPRPSRCGAGVTHAPPAPARSASATHAAAIGHAPKRPRTAQQRPPQCAPLPTAWLLGGASLPWACRQHPQHHHHHHQQQQPQQAALSPPPPEHRREPRHGASDSSGASEEPHTADHDAPHPQRPPPDKPRQPQPQPQQRLPTSEGFALSPDGLLAGLTGRTWPLAVHFPEPPPPALSSFHLEGEPPPPAPEPAPEGSPTTTAFSSSPPPPPRGSSQPPPHLVGERAIGGGGGGAGGGAVLPGANDTLGGLMSAPVRGLRQLNQAVAASVSEFLASDPGRRLTDQMAAEMSSGALMVPVYLTEELVKARLKSLLASHARWLIVYLAVRVSVASALVYGFKALARSLVRKRGPRWLRASVTFCCDVMLPTGFFGPLLGVTAAVVQLTGLGPFIRGYVAAAAGTAVKAGTAVYAGARVATAVRGGARQGAARGSPRSSEAGGGRSSSGGGGGDGGGAAAAAAAPPPPPLAAAAVDAWAAGGSDVWS